MLVPTTLSHTMTPRVALQRLWLATRGWYALVGINGFNFFLVITIANRSFCTSADCPAYLFCFGSWVVVAALATSRNRARLHSALQGLTTSGEANAAASVAALVGQLSLQRALDLGRRNFRRLPFEVLDSQHLATNQESKGLHDATAHTELGSVDVFISHSWHDTSGAKWDVICQWANDFKAREGRWPGVWLDEACINQHAAHRRKPRRLARVLERLPGACRAARRLVPFALVVLYQVVHVPQDGRLA